MYDWLKKTKPIFNENDFLKLYVNFGREELIKRISLRTAKMLLNGAIKEVKSFSNKKLKKGSSVNKVIGLNELKQYLDNQMTLDQVREIIAIRTRQYAKRQATWARSKMISWTKINPSEISSYIKKINKSSLKLDQLI
jgi:tRNA dimethylallyltransferase